MSANPPRFVPPRQAVVIRRGSSLARGLVYDINPAMGSKEQAYRRDMTLTGSLAASEQGLVRTQTGTARAFLIADFPEQRSTEVTLWTRVRRTGTAGSFSSILSKNWQGNADPTYISYDIGCNPAGAGQNVITASKGVSGAIKQVSATHTDTSQWFDACLRITSAGLYLFIDGRQVAIDDVDPAAPIAYGASGDNSWATNVSSSTSPFEYARILQWNRGLTASEIAELSNKTQPLSGFERSLVMRLDTSAGGPPDVTAPTLSAGVGTVKSNALIVVGATTDEAGGTMYVVVTTSATAPSAAQVKAGQNNAGTAAVFAANQPISSTGAKTFNATGFTQLTGYYPYIVHTDASGNDSSVLSVGLRTTFRNGATAQYVIDNTAAVGGNPAGALYALALTKSADDWMAYRTISGPTPGTGTLTENADGSFTFVGPDAAIWVIQPEVNGVDDAGGQITIELYDQASDVTPPTLTTATGTKTGATTATGTVTTSEGLGTLYYLTNTSATALSAAVLAGSTQTVTASGVQNISRTGLTASTTYYHHFLHKDPAGNDSAVLSSNSFTTDAVADVTAPTLTSPTGATLGPTGAVGSVSTNEANGTLYWLTNTSATATDAAIKAANSQAVTATGVQNVTSSGLTASTVYYNHFLHRDAAGNDSTRSTSASFTTAAPGAPVTGNDHGGVAMRSCMRPAMYPAMNKG